MERSSEKQISPLLFLFLIGGFGWLAFTFIGENESNVKAAEKTEIASEQTSVSPTQALTPVYIDEDYEPIVIDVPSSYTNNITSEVLAVTDGGDIEDCNAYSKVVAYQPICLQETTSVNFNDSVDGTTVNVTKDSKIEIAEITEPIIQEGSLYFKKENRRISNEFPSLSSTGGFVPWEYIAPGLLPGEHAKKVRAEYKKADKNISFGVNVNAAFDPSDETTSTIVLNQDRWCNMLPEDRKVKCLENPDIANTNAANIEHRFRIPVSPNEDGPPLLGSCKTFSGSNTQDYTNKSTVACNATIIPIIDDIKAAFSLLKQEDCLLGEDNCSKGVPIVIRVGALHGSADSTTGFVKGESANSFVSLRRRTSMLPGDTSIDREGAEVDGNPNTAYTQPIYARTLCKVRVDGTLHDVDCIWDISYVSEWYERQRIATVTTEVQSKEKDGIPYTLERYLELVNDEMAKSIK